MRIEVKIHPEDSNLMERLYYEHAAGRDNIAFLMKDNDVNKDILQDYIRTVETRFYEMKKCMVLLSKKYEPKECSNGNGYDYTFNFEEESIIYDIK